MDPELERILANVQYMISEDAPESDLKSYLKDEGYTLESLDKAVGKALETDAALERVGASGGPIRDFLHQAAEGATFGQADKIAGAGAAAANALFPAAFPGSFSESQQKFQQRTDDLQTVAPGASAAGMAAGVVAAAPLTGRLARAGLGPAVSAIRTVAGPVAGAAGAAARFGGRVGVGLYNSKLARLGGAGAALRLLVDAARGGGSDK
jgi:hypothetical protein